MGLKCIYHDDVECIFEICGCNSAIDCTDTAGISVRWERRLRAFELLADGKGIKNADQKTALMLHTAGLSVQDIFLILDEGTGENSYLKAKDILSRKQMFRTKGFVFAR